MSANVSTTKSAMNVNKTDGPAYYRKFRNGKPFIWYNDERLPGIRDYLPAPPGLVVDIPPPQDDFDDAQHPNVPPSADENITYLSHDENPALFAAAIDVINMGNELLAEHGMNPSQDEIKKAAKKFRDAHADTDLFPFPPDLRLLCHRTNKKRSTWTEACNAVRSWDIISNDMESLWEVKTAYVYYTKEMHISDSKKYQEDSNTLFKRLMKRYIVRLQHSKLCTYSPDQLPSAILVNKFLDTCPSSGVTLARIHTHFYNVKNIPELIHRISRFCLRHPDDSTLYIRKPTPSREDICDLLFKRPYYLPELLRLHFPSGVGSELDVAQSMRNCAAVDHSTGRYVIRKEGYSDPARNVRPYNRPPVDDLWTHVAKTGTYLYDIIAEFPNQVGSAADFREELAKCAYPFPEGVLPGSSNYPFPAKDQIWFPRAKDGEGGYLSKEKTVEMDEIAKLKERIERNPAQFLNLVNENFEWDEEKGAYAVRVSSIPEAFEFASVSGLTSPATSVESSKRKREDEEVVGEVLELHSAPASPRGRKRICSPSSRRGSF